MYHLTEYINNYTKTSGHLWQYYGDEPAVTDVGAIVNFHAPDKSASCKFKQKVTGVTGDDNRCY